MVVVSFWTAWGCLTVRKEILGLYMAFNGGILGRNTDANTDYTGQGIDQIADVINKLKDKPYD